MTDAHPDPLHAGPPAHPWAAAWAALSPERRVALRASVVDRQPLEDLAARLGRTERDAEALVASTLVAFRREVVLRAGAGWTEECGSLVLPLAERTPGRLARTERKALAAHADTCPDCARAVGELLELDARLRDGLLVLAGTTDPGVPAVERTRRPAGRRRLGIGAGLVATAGAAVALVLAVPGQEARVDVVVAAVPPTADEEPVAATPVSGGVVEGVVEVEVEQAVLPGARISPRPRGAQGRAGAAPSSPESDPESDPESGPGMAPEETPEQGPGTPEAPEPDEVPDEVPDETAEEPGTPPLDVAVDPGTGSVTLTLGLWGEPIVISTPPMPRQLVVNKR